MNDLGKKSAKTRDYKKQGDLAKYDLDAVDLKIIQHLNNFPDTPVKDLAKVAGNYTPSGLYKRMQRPAFKRALEQINEKTYEIIVRAKRKAARKLLDILDDPDPRIRMRAIELALSKELGNGEVDQKDIERLVFRARFGEEGQIIQDTIEVEATDSMKSANNLPAKIN